MGAAIEAAVLDAHRAGLSTIPMRANKRPAISTWKPRIDELPDELTVRREAQMHDGFAITCGGPTRLQVLDFEGRFTEHIPELKVRLGSLAPVFESWLDGYMVTTPGGGFHVAVHVEGDGDQDGNTQLAMDGGRQVLVETRGHGGYVVAAPSNGTTHPSGGAWVQRRGSFAEIAWATVEQWRGVCSAISSFDAVAAASETPPEALPPTALPGGVSISRIEHTSSWLDNVRMPPMAVFLENNGWTYSHSDPDHSYWARPGKDVREGHSATINRSDRLFVFSTSAHPVPSSQPSGQTYDVTDLIGCYRFGHLPTSDERVAIKREFAGLSAQHPPAVRESPAPDSGWLSDDFWDARPWLSAIREAAWAAQRCPEAFLGAVLSTYSVRIPSSIRLEALVGGNESPLNTFVAMVGQTGAGKSGAIGVSRQLCGVTNSESYHYGKTLRSGEGLVTAVIIPQGKRRDEAPLTPLYRNGVQIIYDEGNTLAAQNDRTGSTVISNFCTTWSGVAGSMVGGVLAGGEVSYPADAVRVSLIVGIQFGVGGALFTGSVASQGFPGRLLYFAMDRPGDRSLRRRGTPRVLDLPTYHPNSRSPITMTFPSSVEDDVSAWDEARQIHGVHPLDGHKMLVRMRTAGLLALMDDAAQVELVHWELAGEIEKHSLATRSRVLAGISELSTQSARAAGRNDMVREAARHQAWVEDRARALAQAVHLSPLTARQVKDKFNRDKRQYLSEVVGYALQRNWVVYGTEGQAKLLLPGESRPS